MIDTFVSAGSDGPEYPVGVAFGHDGNLYVGSYGTNEILRYNAGTGAFVDIFVADGRMNGPAQLVIGSDGSLYVSCWNSNEVLRYNTSTGELIQVVIPVSSGLDGPLDLVFDDSGSLYVASNLSDEVYRYDGETTTVFVSSGSGGLDQACGLAFDSDGNLYVTSPPTNQVLRYNGSTGAFMDAFVPAEGVLLSPQDLLFRPDGNLLVTSAATDSILEFHGSTGEFLEYLVVSVGFQVPVDIAFGPDGNVYVNNYSSGSVQHYDAATGAFIDTFVKPNSGGFNGAVGMAFSPEGDLYMASWSQDRVVAFDGTDGSFSSVAPGSGIDGPRGITFGPDGNLYIASEKTHSVFRYEFSTEELVEFVPDGSGGTGGTSGITFGPDGNLYVTRYGSNYVCRYHGTTGALIDVFASGGDPNNPQNLAFGPDGNLYLSSYGDEKVLRFHGTTGEYIDDFVASGNGGMIRPWGLAFDANGMLYAVSTGTQQVLRYENRPHAAFTVTSSNPIHLPLTVDYTTAGGTAVDGSDYEATSGTLTFAPGEESKTILVPTIDDTEDEVVESFFVNLSDPAGATIADGQGVGSIMDRGIVTAPPPGLVSWWTGDGDAQDHVGTNDGTLVGGAAFAPGYVDQAFQFDGVDDFLQAPATSLPTGNADRTVELWVKADSFPTSGQTFIAGYGHFGNLDQAYSLGTVGDELFFSQWGTGLGGPSLAPNQWYHVAVTNVGNFATLYVDGTAVSSGGAFTINTAPGTEFYVGRIGDSQRLDGLVDEVSVYDRALSADEIRFVYEAGTEGKSVGISTIRPSTLVTTEAGGSDQFAIVLDSQPLANVTIPISSSDTTEGTADQTSVTFTPSDWNIPQIVTVTGVDDALPDGDVAYTIVLAPAISADANFHLVNPADVSAVTQNDDGTLFSDSFEVSEWDGLWVEDSQNDWLRSTQRAADGSYSAEVDGRATDARIESKVVDLTLIGSAELTFDWYIEAGLDSGEYLALDFFDGSNWTEVARLSGNVDPESTWHSETIAVDGVYLIDNFQFRFRAKMNKSDEDANVDNVQLVATSLAGPPNDAPVAVDDSATTDEDVSTAPINVLANDSDPDGDTLQVASVTDGANGTVLDNGDGTVTYTPDADFYGADTFTYQAFDGTDYSDPATVTITVSPVNDNPMAVDDSATTEQDTAVVIPVLNNDTDVDLDTLSIQSVGAASNGTVTIGGTSVTYAPDAGYVGNDSFTYTVSDGNGGTDSATVNVEVTRTNDAPVAVDDNYSTSEDVELTIVAPGVLGNDTDGDTDPLTAVLVTGPADGTLTLNPDGSFTYDPDLNFNGTDSFTYKADDGIDRSSVATVNLTTTPVNDAPVAADDLATTDQDMEETIDVLANDIDVDSATLWVTGASDPPDGTVVINADNTITYTPDPGFHDVDTFTYTVSDGSKIDTGTVSVDVAQAGPAMYVYDIRFESRKGGRDWKALVEVRDDSHTPIAGATVTVDFYGDTYTGPTDANGIFRTGWAVKVKSGTYYADVVNLVMGTTYTWDRDLDLEVDDDGDGYIDDFFTK